MPTKKRVVKKAYAGSKKRQAEAEAASRAVKRAKSKVDRAKGVLERADAFIAEYLPDVAGDPLKRRAARTVFYLDKYAMCTLAKEDHRRAMEILERHANGERRYSRRICLLRQHYELSRIQLFSYMEMVDKLAEFS